MGTLCNCLVGALPYTKYTLSHWVIRSLPLCRVKVLHPAQMISSHGDRQTNKTNKKRHPGCLPAHAIGMLYSVVVHRRQPDLYLVYNVCNWRGRGGFVCVWHVSRLKASAVVLPLAPTWGCTWSRRKCFLPLPIALSLAHSSPRNAPLPVVMDRTIAQIFYEYQVS